MMIARQKAGSAESTVRNAWSPMTTRECGSSCPSSVSATRPSRNMMPVSYIARKHSCLSLKWS